MFANLAIVVFGALRVTTRMFTRMLSENLNEMSKIIDNELLNKQVFVWFCYFQNSAISD